MPFPRFLFFDGQSEGENIFVNIKMKKWFVLEFYIYFLVELLRNVLFLVGIGKSLLKFILEELCIGMWNKSEKRSKRIQHIGAQKAVILLHFINGDGRLQNPEEMKNRNRKSPITNRQYLTANDDES